MSEKPKNEYPNFVILGLNAAAEPKKSKDGKPAEVFAIHNCYAGKDKDRVPMPVTIKAFDDQPLESIEKEIKKGYKFIVKGRWEYYMSDDEKVYLSIMASEITDVKPPKGDS